MTTEELVLKTEITPKKPRLTNAQWASLETMAKNGQYGKAIVIAIAEAYDIPPKKVIELSIDDIMKKLEEIEVA